MITNSTPTRNAILIHNFLQCKDIKSLLRRQNTVAKQNKSIRKRVSFIYSLLLSFLRNINLRHTSYLILSWLHALSISFIIFNMCHSSRGFSTVWKNRQFFSHKRKQRRKKGKKHTHQTIFNAYCFNKFCLGSVFLFVFFKNKYETLYGSKVESNKVLMWCNLRWVELGFVFLWCSERFLQDNH